MKKRLLSILLAAAMITGLVTLPVVAADVKLGSTMYASYEAEANADSRTNANPSPQTDFSIAGASGGKVVARFWGAGLMNPWSGWAGGAAEPTYTESASISFTHNVAVAGNYGLILQYQADKDYILNLYVNGTRQDLPIAAGGTKDTAEAGGTVVKSAPVIVNLNAGNNTIKIESTTLPEEGHAENICPDIVYVSNAPVQVTIDGVVCSAYEAEANADSRTNANPSPQTDFTIAGASGGKVIGRFWGAGLTNPWSGWAGGAAEPTYIESASFSVIHKVAEAGNYSLVLQYQADKDYVLNLYVNGVKQDFPITAGGTKDTAEAGGTVVRSAPVTINLNAGDNTIKIESTTLPADGHAENICPDVVYITNTVSAPAYTVDTTGFTTKYTQDFANITNDAAGKDELKKFWSIEVDGDFAGSGINVANGALNFRWVTGRALYSNDVFEKSIVSFDAKTVGSDLKVFAIRQIATNGVYQRENDKYPSGAQAGLEGILFSFGPNNVVVTVDDTTIPASVNEGKADAEKVTSWNTSSSIALPIGVNFNEALNKVTVVDNGTTVKLVIGDVLIATIELDNLVDGVYKTATIKDGNGNTLATTTTANVPKSGKLGFGVRGDEMTIDNINIMTVAQTTENPNTLDLGAIQITVMAAASAVVALKRKKQSI